MKMAAASLLPLAALVGLAVADARSRPERETLGKHSHAASHAPSLNHVYIVLDQATFDAIRNSRELARLLGRADGGLPDYAPPSLDADRIFFRGRHTYLELFAPKNRFNEPVGKIGLALGHDQPRRFEMLATAWRNLCGSRFRRTPVDYSRVQPPIPWYEAVQCDDTASGPHLALWGMVYRPDFYRWQTKQKAGGAPRTARADILAPRLADGQGRFDIAALSINVTPTIYPALGRQLERAGMVRNGPHFSGEGWTLTLRAHDTPGLSSLTLATATSAVRDEHLGAVTLIGREDRSLHLSFAGTPN